MGFKFKTGEDVSDSIGLLISILVRYPEVGTINYDPDTSLLSLTFMVYQLQEDSHLQAFTQLLEMSLESFNLLEGRKPKEIRLLASTNGNFTCLELLRDVDTLAQDEFALIISLMRQQFGDQLVTDQNEEMQEEELEMQEEMIEHMLQNVKGNFSKKKLIGFREDGRVLVFNK